MENKLKQKIKNLKLELSSLHSKIKLQKTLLDQKNREIAWLKGNIKRLEKGE